MSKRVDHPSGTFRCLHVVNKSGTKYSQWLRSALMEAGATPVQSLLAALARWCGIVVGYCAATWLTQQGTLQTERATWVAVRLGSIEVIRLSRYVMSRRGLTEEESSVSSVDE